MQHFRLSLKLMIAVFLAGSQVLPAQAEWVEVTGQALIVNGDKAAARKVARKDALELAAQQVNTSVSGRQRLVQGLLTEDRLDVRTRARARKVEVLDEKEFNQRLSLKIRADMVSLPVCPGDHENNYRKRVAVTGFALQRPEQAAYGRLENVQRDMAGLFNRILTEKGDQLMFESSQYGLYTELANAPTAETEIRTLTKAVELAKEMGSQFVLSGIVRDLGLVDDQTYNTSVWGRFKRAVNATDTRRRFAFEVFIHDGFSGALVFQQHYEVIDRWEFDLEEVVGFATPKFWNSDYGQSVQSLMDVVMDEVNDTLSCQPFMARITRIDGNTVNINMGSRTGLRPGDQLAVYRTYQYYDSNLLQGTELSNVKSVATVTQVHPTFTTAELKVDGARLNIQTDDLLVAW